MTFFTILVDEQGKPARIDPDRGVVIAALKQPATLPN